MTVIQRVSERKREGRLGHPSLPLHLVKCQADVPRARSDEDLHVAVGSPPALLLAIPYGEVVPIQAESDRPCRIGADGEAIELS